MISGRIHTTSTPAFLDNCAISYMETVIRIRPRCALFIKRTKRIHTPKVYNLRPINPLDNRWNENIPIKCTIQQPNHTKLLPMFTVRCGQCLRQRLCEEHSSTTADTWASCVERRKRIGLRSIIVPNCFHQSLCIHIGIIVLEQPPLRKILSSTNCCIFTDNLHQRKRKLQGRGDLICATWVTISYASAARKLWILHDIKVRQSSSSLFCTNRSRYVRHTIRRAHLLLYRCLHLYRSFDIVGT